MEGKALAKDQLKSSYNVTLELKIPSKWRYKRTYGMIPAK